MRFSKNAKHFLNIGIIWLLVWAVYGFLYLLFTSGWKDHTIEQYMQYYWSYRGNPYFSKDNSGTTSDNATITNYRDYELSSQKTRCSLGNKTLKEIQICIDSYTWSNSLPSVINTTDITQSDSERIKSSTKDTSVIIIGIDNRTLDILQTRNLNEWLETKNLTISKQVYTDLIAYLEQSQVVSIGFDIVFANKSHDANVLANTLQRDAQKAYPLVSLWVKLWDDVNNEVVLPLPEYASWTWGNIQLLAHYGVWDRYEAAKMYSWKLIETLWMAVYRKKISDSWVGKYLIDNSKQDWLDKFLHIDRHFYQFNPRYQIPVTEKWEIIIPFRHIWDWTETFQYYSLIDVLDGKIPREVFKNKIVLVWEKWTLIHDEYFVPIIPNLRIPWVEFHAYLIEALISKHFLSYQHIYREYFYLCILLLFLVPVFYFSNSFLFSLLIFMFSLGVLYFSSRELLAQNFLSYFNIKNSQEALIINIFSYIIFLFSTFLVSYFYKYFVIDRNRRYLTNAFSHYISPEIVKQIADNPELLDLGWQDKDLTIFFSDIAGFTTISEMLGTKALFPLMSEYLSEMTDILTHNSGTLDKYIGDAVMGFFGAPISLRNASFLACKTAIEQQKRLIELNKKWEKEGYPPILVRIGIASGVVMVGNIGSKEHFNYTVLGDTVNLSSRLEWVNKEYSTNICVSETVYEQVKDTFFCRKLDCIQVKWKTEWVKIYELVGYQEDTNIVREKYIQYELWFEQYVQWNYDEAEKIWKENKQDGVSYILLERIRWIRDGKIVVKNGIYEMKTK